MRVHARLRHARKRVHARLRRAIGRCTARPGHKIAKTTPCKVEWAPGSQHSCCAASGAREEKWSVVTAPNLSHPALGLTLLERHLRRALQKILAEIFQDLPRRQKQAVAPIGLDRQGHHGRLIWIRDQLVSPDRICRQFLYVTLPV